MKRAALASLAAALTAAASAAAFVPDDPLAELQWHLAATRAFEAWPVPPLLAPVRVAVIDSGVDRAHPDLRVADTGFDIFDNDDDASPVWSQDGANHGTAVAGLAAAIGGNGRGVVGVAPAAEVLPVRAVGTDLTLFGVYSAFAFATDAGAVVLNNSWGFGDDACGGIDDYEVLRDAMEYPRLEGRGGLGAVVVFASGNSDCDIAGVPMLGLPGVIAVGATSDRDRRVGYSNFGTFLDVMAPSGGAGASLVTTDGSGELGWNDLDDLDTTASMSGTSGAAPIVAGVVALMIAANPRLPEERVRAILCDTALRVAPDDADYDATGWSALYGCGRVDAGAAVAASADTLPVPARWLDDAEVVVGPSVGLRWEQTADPDGDALRFELELDGPDGITLVPLEADRWRGALAAGDWSAVVHTVDRWGRAASSIPRSFKVVLPEEPEGQGCGGAAWLPLVPLWRRRCTPRSSR